MFKHTIFDLLRTFSEKEIKRFSDFLYSPYFNKSRKVIELYDELIRYYPSFKNDELTKEKLYRKLIRRGDYKDPTIRKMLHDLLQLLQKFIVQEHIRDLKFEQDEYLLKELAKRNQIKLCKMNIKRVESYINNTKCINIAFIYKQYLFEAIKYNFSVLNPSTIKIEKADEILKGALNGIMCFITHFILELLDEYLFFHYESDRYNFKYEDSYFLKFIESLNLDEISKNISNDNKYYFMIEIYNSMYKTIKDFENDENYFKYKKLILKYIKKLSSDEITVHYARLINYCISKSESSHKRKIFKPELVKIYEIILKNDYYKTDLIIYLPPELFRNVFFDGQKIYKPDWMLKYIKENVKKLHPAIQTNMCNFAYSYYYHALGDYKKSQYYIKKVSLDRYIYIYDMKNLSLQNFFELNYFEEVLSLIHNYRENLRSNKIFSEDRKLRKRNFLSYLEKIVLIKTGKSKLSIGYVKDKLRGCDQILLKEWLLEKVEELEVKV